MIKNSSYFKNRNSVATLKINSEFIDIKNVFFSNTVLESDFDSFCFAP